MPPRAVLFDFELTLADSTAGVIECANFALVRQGLALAEAEAIRRTIGLPLPEKFRALSGLADAPRERAFVDAFLLREQEAMADLTYVFPAAREGIAALRARGVRTGIVSTKYSAIIERILARDGLAECFDVIVGGEDVARFKPDPEGLLRALGRLDLDRAQVLYVGDHPLDARAAAAAGLRFVAALSGCNMREHFAGLAVTGFVPDLRALPQLVAQSA